MVRALLPVALFELGNVATTLLILRATNLLATPGRSVTAATSLAVLIYPAHHAAGATAGLILVIFSLARSGRAERAPAAVGAYIGAAYFFTSSTSFANPAITIGRIFSNTFAGIAPSSAPLFLAAQLLGGALAVLG